MKIVDNFRNLCNPAQVYFWVSLVIIFMAILQNIGNSTKYSLGNFSCNVPSTIIVFVLKLIYVIFWTWVLNLICKDGHKGIAWFLVIFPIILFFVVIGLFMLYFNDAVF